MKTIKLLDYIHVYLKQNSQNAQGLHTWSLQGIRTLFYKDDREEEQKFSLFTRRWFIDWLPLVLSFSMGLYLELWVQLYTELTLKI